MVSDLRYLDPEGYSGPCKESPAGLVAEDFLGKMAQNGQPSLVQNSVFLTRDQAGIEQELKLFTKYVPLWHCNASLF